MFSRLLLVITVSFFAVTGALVRAPDTMASDLLDLLRAEDLATITIEQPVYFSTPTGSDVIASPGVYRIVLDEQERLRFVPLKGPKDKEPFLVQGLTTNHRDQIPSPVALYIADDEKAPHIVLLLPGGKGFEAIGSLTDILLREIHPRPLTPERLHEALLEKLTTIRKGEPK